jgi:AcrR family transcriptional regulator
MADNLQTQIVSAARSRFRHYGFAKTSMQEIAEDCGMSAANLYRYYENKQGIAAAVIKTDLTQLYDACRQAVELAGPHVAPALIALFGASIETTRRQLKQAPLLFELSMAVTREMPSLRIQVLGEIRRMITEILRAGQLRGEIPDGNAAERAELILMAGAPFVMPWMLLNQPFGDPRDKVAPLMHWLVAGLTAPTPTSTP